MIAALGLVYSVKVRAAVQHIRSALILFPLPSRKEAIDDVINDAEPSSIEASTTWPAPVFCAEIIGSQNTQAQIEVNRRQSRQSASADALAAHLVRQCWRVRQRGRYS